jgi:hypothetical protein
MPADPMADRGKRLSRLLDVIFADGRHSGFDSFQDFGRRFCLSRGDEENSGRQFREDAGNVIPDRHGGILP